MSKEQRSPILEAVPTGAAEGEVITQNVYGAVRTLAEQGASKKSIARQLGVHVQTVRKWLRRSWSPGKRAPRGQVLDAWQEFLRPVHPRSASTRSCCCASWSRRATPDRTRRS